MAENVEVEITKEKEEKKYKLFYGLSIIMILYMGFSAYITYETFIEYCKAYSLVVSSEWFMFVKSLLAAVVPCLVYAATMYGIGYILQHHK